MKDVSLPWDHPVIVSCGHLVLYAITRAPKGSENLGITFAIDLDGLKIEGEPVGDWIITASRRAPPADQEAVKPTADVPV